MSLSIIVSSITDKVQREDSAALQVVLHLQTLVCFNCTIIIKSPSRSNDAFLPGHNLFGCDWARP